VTLPTLPNLHDSVLERIEINWEAATATVRFGLVGDTNPPPSLTLVFSGFREIHVPRDEPWGPSDFVEVADYVDGSIQGGVTLRVEMQSGDELRLRAEALKIA
jgi:hypothetical protein